MNHTRRSPLGSPPCASRDHYQEVTDRIVAALEQGVLPWRRPWNPAKAGQSTMPHNAATRHVYKGINVLLLAMSPLSFTTCDSRWCSYRQAQERGWQVRRGERGTTIFFFKRLAVGDAANGTSPGRDTATGEAATEAGRFIPLLRAHSVFHASQVDGIPDAAPAEQPEASWRRPEAVDVILRNSGAQVRIGGAEAFYCPATDRISLPPEGSFESAAAWGSVALHELGHWSGAPSRLDRDLCGRFGTVRYAEEELRAEIASAFMGAELGLPCDILGHASYVQSWLRKLREDKREVFRAAAAAQRIADYCLAFHPDYRAEARARAEPDEVSTEQDQEERQAA